MGKIHSRIGTAADVAAVIEIARAMHAGSRYSRLPFDAERLRGLLAWLAGHGDGLFLVTVAEGEIVGALAACAVEHPWLSAQAANAFELFVRPEHHGGVIGARLLKGYIAWAREMEIPGELITASEQQGHGSSAYTACGFKPTGNVYACEEAR